MRDTLGSPSVELRLARAMARQWKKVELKGKGGEREARTRKMADPHKMEWEFRKWDYPTKKWGDWGTFSEGGGRKGDRVYARKVLAARKK